MILFSCPCGADIDMDNTMLERSGKVEPGPLDPGVWRCRSVCPACGRRAMRHIAIGGDTLEDFS